MSWRSEARAALREYPKAKRRGDAAVVLPVEAALERQKGYYNAADRLRMVDMVYFRRTHTLIGAAVECGYSIETVKKWNLEILAAVDGRLNRPG